MNPQYVNQYRNRGILLPSIVALMLAPNLVGHFAHRDGPALGDAVLTYLDSLTTEQYTRSSLLYPVTDRRLPSTQPSTLFDIALRSTALGDFAVAVSATTPYSLSTDDGLDIALTLELSAVSVPEVVALLTELYPIDVAWRGNHGHITARVTPPATED